MLSIKNLSATIGGKRILDGISFDFKPGKTYAIMGPNGSGKSTLASVIMGRPDAVLVRGSQMSYRKKDLRRLSPDKRAALGIALSFQSPLALPGVTVSDLLRVAVEKRLDPISLHQKIHAYAAELRIKGDLLKRSLNDGFSGGERKKFEALQLAILEPSFAMFDEIDTGVDVDALKTITAFLKKRLPKDATRVFITHSMKLLRYVNPDEVLVIKDGCLVKTGKAALAKKIEKEGFETIA